ncbi:hypothetical protein [Blastococcus sp. LR1]|uniref:hypothetical protein n=1 Tax=Blastococcus sp. LR1 TaxID=2877000 RepID=UPI001CCD767C|nr:hypothetical protein [Blastococcus sp. LR1]MCA0145997.1 hypothetical protein [Blastococcus sp. LR1]
MGRHTAADGASADPLVAAALAQRPAAGTGAHHGIDQASSGEGGLGWPTAPESPEPGDGGLGWPGGGSGNGTEDSAAVPEDDARPRRGWRRIFGASAA